MANELFTRCAFLFQLLCHIRYANEREFNEITVGKGIIFMNGTANRLGSPFLNHPLNLQHLLC
ncbi:hypothetical protein, partial [Paenibacillus riograndensis]|uniref:hypothetical protein n=1 Tax=Paenibacillus riograndensis TaxID=483937 RepID=UPI00058511AD